MSTLKGIDVSNYQPATITRDVASPIDFAIIKATGGTGYTNPNCNAQVEHAVQAGLNVGLYHFAKDGFNIAAAKVEADFFVDSILGHLKYNPMLVLDWEADAARDLSLAWARTWLDRVYERTGVKPLFYSYANFIQTRDMSQIISGDYGLWVASYGSGNRTSFSEVPEAPASSWPVTAMFQFTSSGRLPGYNGPLDLNVFYGDQAAWNRYTGKKGGGSGTPSKPPAKKTTQQLAAEVWDNKWGTGADRVARLKAAGYSSSEIAAIQAEVDRTAPQHAAPTYTIKPGDNLSSIAAQHGTTWQNLARINGISNPNLVYPGQVIKLK